jgi:hypothetical protein
MRVFGVPISIRIKWTVSHGGAYPQFFMFHVAMRLQHLKQDADGLTAK